MIEFVCLEVDAANPCAHFTGNGVHYHECGLYHLAVVLDGIVGSHHSILLALGVPCKNFHWYFLMEAGLDFFVGESFVGEVSPAIALFHGCFEYVFMTFPNCSLSDCRLSVER